MTEKIYGIIYKTCTKCGIELPAVAPEYFKRSKKAEDDLSPWCKECIHVHQEEYHWGNREKYRESYYRYHYGIGIEEYDTLFRQQNGCCAVCGRHQVEFTKRLHIDHNHETGEVRGLLCQHCNMCLGQFEGWAVRNKEGLEGFLQRGLSL